MINVGYKDKIFCGNSVSILKSFYFFLKAFIFAFVEVN